MLLPLLLLLSCLLAASIPREATALSKRDILKKLINENYDAEERPPAFNEKNQSGPVNVDVNMYIRSISNIDPILMRYDMQITFREIWKDPRLAYERLGGAVPKYVLLHNKDAIWRPDTFFQNELRAHTHDVDTPNVMLRVSPDGTVFYSRRLSLTATCPMNLEHFPMDKQTCLLDFASYVHTTDDIVYTWKSVHPVQQKDGVRHSLPAFDLTDLLTDYCTSKTNTGTYSCLRLKLILERRTSYYMLQVFIPSTCLVFVSYISFFLDRQASAARVTLVTAALLAVMAMSALVNSQLPPVSYTKAIDVWFGVCLSFIFAALVEYAYVSFVTGQGENKSAKTNGQLYRTLPNTTDDQPEQRVKKECHGDKAMCADFISRILFPVGFLVFNLYFWIRY